MNNCVVHWIYKHENINGIGKQSRYKPITNLLIGMSAFMNLTNINKQIICEECIRSTIMMINNKRIWIYQEYSGKQWNYGKKYLYIIYKRHPNNPCKNSKELHTSISLFFGWTSKTLCAPSTAGVIQCWLICYWSQCVT